MENNQVFDNLYKRLKNELPYYLYYHCPEHTLSVMERAEFLAKKENLSNAEIYIIKVAALYHDAGFLIGRDDHETKSCNLASKELPEYNFSKKEIKTICGMINATRIPQKTHNNYENIVADADLFYLGTVEYDFYSEKLYLELKHFNPEITDKEWVKIQLDFLKAHHFHTDYALKFLAPVKDKHFKNLARLWAKM